MSSLDPKEEDKPIDGDDKAEVQKEDATAKQATQEDLKPAKRSKATVESPVEGKKSKQDTDGRRSTNSLLMSHIASQQQAAQAAVPSFSAATYLQGLAAFPPYPGLFGDPAHNAFLASSFGLPMPDVMSSTDSLLKPFTQVQSMTNGLGQCSNAKAASTPTTSKANDEPTSLSALISNTRLSSAEVSSLRQLIVGYRESAALLLKTADELEQMLGSRK